ncbi:MAG: hypothetical protein JXA49_08735 [Actinobacteria bacterium]|nr:hypothetical protein [Actinomycetota bacterium]
MKRMLVALAAALLVTGLLVFLPGCGSDTAKAEEYLLAGDKIAEEAQEESRTAALGISTILLELQAGNVNTRAGINEITTRFKSDTEVFFNKSDEAKEKYGNVLKLKGVEVYKEYARLMIDSITFREEAVFSFTAMLGSAGELAGMFESGTEVELAQFQAVGEDFSNKFREASENAQRSGERAEKLKQKNNL